MTTTTPKVHFSPCPLCEGTLAPHEICHGHPPNTPCPWPGHAVSMLVQVGEDRVRQLVREEAPKVSLELPEARLRGIVDDRMRDYATPYLEQKMREIVSKLIPSAKMLGEETAKIVVADRDRHWRSMWAQVEDRVRELAREEIRALKSQPAAPTKNSPVTCGAEAEEVVRPELKSGARTASSATYTTSEPAAPASAEKPQQGFFESEYYALRYRFLAAQEEIASLRKERDELRASLERTKRHRDDYIDSCKKAEAALEKVNASRLKAEKALESAHDVTQEKIARCFENRARICPTPRFDDALAARYVRGMALNPAAFRGGPESERPSSKAPAPASEQSDRSLSDLAGRVLNPNRKEDQDFVRTAINVALADHKVCSDPSPKNIEAKHWARQEFARAKHALERIHEHPKD